MPQPKPVPTIKNLFNENRDYSNSGIRYTIDPEGHLATFTTLTKTGSNLSTDVILSIPVKECIGKTLYVRADSTGMSIATEYKFTVILNDGYGMYSIGELNTWTMPSLKIPVSIITFDREAYIEIRFAIQSSRDGVSLATGSYAQFKKLMFSLEKAKQWYPYQE